MGAPAAAGAAAAAGTAATAGTTGAAAGAAGGSSGGVVSAIASSAFGGFLDDARLWLTDFIFNPDNDAMKSTVESAITMLKVSEAEASVVVTVLSLTLPIALLLATTNFLVGFGNDMIYERGQEDPLKALVRAGIWFLISITLLNNISAIISFVMSLYNALGTTATDIVMKSDAVKAFDAIEFLKDPGELKKMSVISIFFAFTIGHFAQLLTLISNIAIIFICFSAKIEFLLRLGFLPIGFAMAADQERHHQTMIYLRKLIASGFQCVGIIGAIFVAFQGAQATRITSTSFGTVFTDPGRSILGTLGTGLMANALLSAFIPFAAIGAISVGKAAINEAFGG